MDKATSVTADLAIGLGIVRALVVPAIDVHYPLLSAAVTELCFNRARGVKRLFVSVFLKTRKYTFAQERLACAGTRSHQLSATLSIWPHGFFGLLPALRLILTITPRPTNLSSVSVADL